MDGFQQTIISKIGSLPPDVNPFDAIDQFLLETVAPQRPKSFEVQLIICMVAHGICGLLVLASLVVRIYRGSFWIIRFEVKNPKLWRPHFAACWSIWAVILNVFLELAVYNAKTLSNGLQPKYAYYWTFAWIPAWLGGFSAAWAITVSLLLHLYNSGKDNQLVEKISPIVNTLSLLLPSIYLAVLIPLALRCSQYYEAAIYDIEEIRGFLHASAAKFNGRFSLLDLAPIIPTTHSLQQAYTGFQKWLKITFAFYAVSALLLVLLLATVATLYVRLLRRSLKEIGDTSTLREDGLVHRKVMEKTYSNLVVTLICFTTIGSIFSGMSFYIATNPEFIYSRVAAEVVCLLAFYTFALFGLPTSFLLFIRSFDRNTASTAFPSTSSTRPSIISRGRSHSHLPSLSLHLGGRKLSDASKPIRNSPGDSDEDKFTSLPRGFEIVLSPTKPARDSIRSIEAEKGESDYPPSPISSTRPPPLPYYYAPNARYSYASTTNALNESTSTRATLSEFTSSIKDGEFGTLGNRGQTGGGVNEMELGDKSEAFVFAATSKIE